MKRQAKLAEFSHPDGALNSIAEAQGNAERGAVSGKVQTRSMAHTGQTLRPGLRAARGLGGAVRVVTAVGRVGELGANTERRAPSLVQNGSMHA